MYGCCISGVGRINWITVKLPGYDGKYIQTGVQILKNIQEDIKSGKDPEFTFSDFMAMYTENTNDVLIGKNSDRAIGLTNDRISTNKSNGINFWYISPLVGKQGQPMTVFKRSTGKKYDFGADATALWLYIIIICLYMKIIVKLLLFFIDKIVLVVRACF